MNDVGSFSLKSSPLHTMYAIKYSHNIYQKAEQRIKS